MILFDLIFPKPYRKSSSLMGQFIKFVLATIVGLGLFIFLLFGVLLVFGLAAGSNGNETTEVKSNSILRIRLNREVRERAPENPLEEFGLPSNNVPTGLVEIKEAIAKAKTDDRIKGISLELSFLPMGQSMAHEVRQALVDFKTSGKFVYAYSDMMSEGAYYIASVADSIYLHPLGAIEFNGFSSESVFFKGLFAKVGIEPIIFRVGTYKSAVEPFMLDKMSEASRAQTTAFLGSLYDFYLTNVAEARGIDKARLREIADQMLVRNAGTALEHKLVHDTLHHSQYQAILQKAVGVEKTDDLEYVGLSQYMKAENPAEEEKSSNNRIAVIIAEGTIGTGNSSDGMIGSETIVKQLRKVAEDDKVKAVVLRINSPGGSALASDIMWYEIQQLKAKKPIIASMSDVAASGGYYMAMGCDTIVAYPNTITGSIGIFGMLFNTQALMTDKLGLTFDRVNTGTFADLGNPNRPMTDAEKAIFQTEIERGYETFTGKAAAGRGLSLDSLKSLASGRVWSGVEAKQRGLVDVLGGMEEAVSIAAAAAGVADDFKVKYYPPKKSFFETIFEMAEDEMARYYLQRELGALYPLHQQIKRLEHLQGIQAYMPPFFLFR